MNSVELNANGNLVVTPITVSEIMKMIEARKK